jgi:hypothetical protein
VKRWAFVISSHGYGHATRAVAVAEEWLERDSDLELILVTRSPRWLFAELLATGRVEVWRSATDVGFIQSDAVAEDHARTAAEAARYLDRLPRRATDLARRLRRARVVGVAVDIAPLGLAAAEAAGVPGVLIESFTWDWLYERSSSSQLRGLAERFAAVFATAEVRVRCAPWCGSAEVGDRQVEPIVRRAGLGRSAQRRALGLETDDVVVLATMGGFGWRWPLEQLAALPRSTADGRRLRLVAPGAPAAAGRLPNVIRLPHHHRFRHPDLVGAADLVVGKLGYGTVAETARAGARLLWVRRPSFPESAELEQWVSRHLVGCGVDPEALADGSWIGAIGDALAPPARPAVSCRGAAQVVDVLEELA